MRVTYFDNTFNNQPLTADGSWDDFVDLMKSAATQPRDPSEKRAKTPMISPAIYPEGLTRANLNVIRMAAWLPMDVDHNGVLVDDMVEYLDALGVDFIIHSTTNHRPGNECFRVIVRLDREIDVLEADGLWKGAFEFFGGITDVQTKDPARGFYVPAAWTGTDPRFEYRSTGRSLATSDVLAKAPPPPPPPPPVPVSKAQMTRIKRAIAGSGKGLKNGETLFDSPIVSSRAVDDYLSLPKGQHHVGLFQFMTRVAARAVYLGYSIEPSDIATFARQLNDISIVKTATNRNFLKEAQAAQKWAINNTNTKEFIDAQS